MWELIGPPLSTALDHLNYKSKTRKDQTVSKKLKGILERSLKFIGDLYKSNKIGIKITSNQHSKLQNVRLSIKDFEVCEELGKMTLKGGDQSIT